jgi:hypothetical protein
MTTGECAEEQDCQGHLIRSRMSGSADSITASSALALYIITPKKAAMTIRLTIR